MIRSGLGSIPLVRDKEDKEEDEDADAPAAAPLPASNRPALLPDGSYATQVSWRPCLLCQYNVMSYEWLLCLGHVRVLHACFACR